MARRDDAEFAEFAVAVREGLRRTAYLLCGDWHRAADIAQEALVRVYVAWPRIRNKDGAHAYARKALISVAIDLGRRRMSTETPVLNSGLNRPVVDDTARLDDRELLLGALRALPERQRACVVLRFFDDASVADTAQLLGCSEGTVKSQTARALARLRIHLSADLPIAGDPR